jgi:O-antigen/teichoic acid export membrane protein
MAYSVAQNTTFLTLATILQKIISSAYFFVVFYFVGESVRGDYFAIFASIAIFTVLADLGFGSVLTRETSQNTDKWVEYLYTVFISKICFGLVAAVLLILCKEIFNYPGQSFTVVVAASVVLFLDNLQTTLYGIFRAHKNLLFEALGLVMVQILILIIGSTALYFHKSLVWLLVAFIIPYGLNIIYAFTILVKKFNLPLKPVFDKKIFLKFFVFAIPFAIAGIVGRLYTYSDSIIMSSFLSKKEIGWWGLSFKIAYVFQLIPVALGASIYPVISSSYVTQKEKVFELIERCYEYLFLISLPIIVGTVLVAPRLFHTFVPNFYPAVLTLQILICGIVFDFISFVHGATLNASKNQNYQTTAVLVALSISVGLNLVLIPLKGVIGAAITSVISSFALFLMGYIFMVWKIKFPATRIFYVLNRIIWPVLTMGVVVYLSLFVMPAVLTIPIGMIVYVCMLFLTKVFNKQSIVDFSRKIKPKSIPNL